MANSIGGSTLSTKNQTKISQGQSDGAGASGTAQRAALLDTASGAAATDTLQSQQLRLQEQQARGLVGADTSLHAPGTPTSTQPALNLRRGLADPAALATPDAGGVSDTAGTDGTAAVEPTEAASEPPDVVAARVNSMAESDPEGAARVYADAIEANDDPAYRAELTEAAQPGLETIGRASATYDDPTGAVVGELSRASEALHAGGQPEVARSLADGFARGVDGVSREHYERTGIPVGSPAVQDAFAAQVGSGNGANFAADVTSSFAGSARAGLDEGADGGELRRRENLTANAAGGLSEGVNTLEERFSSQGEALVERSARLQESEERYGPYLSDEERDAAHAETGVETARLVGEYDESAGQLNDAVEATARAYDSIDTAADGRGFFLSTARNDVHAALDGAVRQMPAVGATLTGQAAIADTVSAQQSGERTWLDTMADMRADGVLDDDTATAAFAASTQGAALLGAADYGSGGTLERAQGAIAHNAAALLDEEGQAAVNDALGQMNGATDSAEAFSAFTGSLEQNEDALGGPQVATALGAMGTILGKPDVISSDPAYGRYSGAAGVLASAAGLALSGPGDTFQENVRFGMSAANTATDAIEVLAPGTRLGGWASVGGRFLGVAGAAWGLADAIGQGDGLGVASSGLALYGALAMNPYAAVAAGLIEGGRFLWDVRQDAQAQSAIDSEYLQGAGISQENAEFVSGIGGFGPPLLSEHGRQHSGIDDLNARLDYYRDGGDYGAVHELWRLEQLSPP